MEERAASTLQMSGSERGSGFAHTSGITNMGEEGGSATNKIVQGWIDDLQGLLKWRRPLMFMDGWMEGWMMERGRDGQPAAPPELRVHFIFILIFILIRARTLSFQEGLLTTTLGWWWWGWWEVVMLVMLVALVVLVGVVAAWGRLAMYIYICICIYIPICMYICLYIHIIITYIHMYICIYLYIYIYIPKCVHVDMYVYRVAGS